MRIKSNAAAGDRVAAGGGQARPRYAARHCGVTSEIRRMSNTCRSVDALIARAAQLTPNEAAKLEAHLASCDSCRELARALKPVNDSAFAATCTPETNVAPHANAAIAGASHDLPESTRY